MKTAYLGKLSLVLLASTSVVVGAAPAYAQTNGGVSLDEIVVTAQKREENLQEITLAVSALDAELIDQLGITDTQGISGLAPNVTVVGGTTSLGAAVISIRGIPSPAAETFGFDTANAFYVDGVYISRSAATGLDVLDLERVEVLRGPQGTLFGRNTTGGAISFISKDPSEEFSLSGEVGAGNFGAFNGKVNLQPGSLGGLKTSISYSHRQRDGVVDNLLASDDNDPGARNSDAFRFAAKYDFDDTASLRYIGDWSEVEGRAQAFQLTNVADGTPRPNLTLPGGVITQTQQAPVSQYLAGVNFLEPGCQALSAPQRERRDEICLNSDGDAVEETWGHNLLFTKDFGSVTLKSTTAHRRWDSSVGSSDLDGLGTIEGAAFSPASLFNGQPAALLPFVGVPAAFAPFVSASPVPRTTQDLFDTNSERSHTQFSQELELSGDTDSMDWVVGGFYFNEAGTEVNPQNSGFVLDTNNIFGNFGALSPSFIAANPEQYRLVQTLGVLNYKANANSTAIYGQSTFYPGGRDGRLNLTVGGRYTWDDKSLTKFQDGTAALAVAQVGEQDFSKFTWNLAAGYDLSDEVNLFARVATGYRSGGFNAADDAPAGSNAIPAFDEETLTSYEVGFKSELFERRLRLNASAYYNNYEDLAVIVPVADTTPGTFGSRNENAGDVDYLGFEAEFTAILTENFSLDGNMGYVDVNFNEVLAGIPANGTEPVDISSLAVAQYTSPFTANIAANYERKIDWKDATLRARIGFTHEDGKYSFISTTAAPFNEQLRGDDRDVIDAQIGIYDFNAGATNAYVQLWGKNLTDSGDLVRGVDFGPLGYAGGYFADPRTYGITLGFEY